MARDKEMTPAVKHDILEYGGLEEKTLDSTFYFDIAPHPTSSKKGQISICTEGIRVQTELALYLAARCMYEVA
jgi:hypothetical protein